MWVIEDHLRPSGHIMPDHAGDRGAELLVLAPHDHLHINPCEGALGAPNGLICVPKGRSPGAAISPDHTWIRSGSTGLAAHIP
jgi:hypothetical protein